MDTEWLVQTWQWLEGQPWILGLALLVAAVLAAKLADFLFSRLLRFLVARTSTKVDDQIVAQLHRPVQASVVLAAAVVAAHAIIVDDHLRSLASRFLYSLLLVLWTGVAIRASRTFFRALIQHRRADHAVVQALPLLDNLITVVLVVHGAFWLLAIWDVNLTPLLASAGIVTAAVALASRDTLANFFGGVSIFVDRPYRLGDYIILESGERGEVVNIGVRSTRILTRDDVLITVPNAVMANAKIINESGQVPRYRVRATVGVAYDSDLELVEAKLLEALEDISEILPEPAPRVRFRQFGDSALIYQVLAWVRDPADRGRVLHEINRNIHRKLGEAGIEIPFPQRVVTMRGETDGNHETVMAGQGGKHGPS